MHPLTTTALLHGYLDAQTFHDPLTSTITTDQFSASYADPPSWAIGPFRRDPSLTFRSDQWADPTGIGWRHGFLFNPSLLVRGDELHLFYRASPRKESLSSRIGHAVHTAASGWVDDPGNPVVYPTLPQELASIDDPKVYAADGRFVLFYNGIWPLEGTSEYDDYGSGGSPSPALGCDIMVASSDDLLTWTKHGSVVPHEVSRLWAKGAVIPRTPTGEAVRIGGEYLMYVSEGCGGQQVIGRSTDLIIWSFEPHTYLDLGGLGGGSLFEVATASTGHDASGSLVLDFFYNDASGSFAAGQARYDVSDPFTQLDVHRGGALAWGGFADYRSALYFAQGWDAPEGSRELYFYREVGTDAP